MTDELAAYRALAIIADAIVSHGPLRDAALAGLADITKGGAKIDGRKTS